jgi:hypothetical protein
MSFTRPATIEGELKESPGSSPGLFSFQILDKPHHNSFRKKTLTISNLE